MGKRLTECCDQWGDLQTMILADNMCDAQFEPLLNNCDSLEDFECKVKNNICNQIEDNKALCNVISDDTLRMLALSALMNVDVDKLIQIVLTCFEPQLKIFKLESRVNNICKHIYEKRNLKLERETTPAADGELAAFDIAVNFDKDSVDVDSSVDVKNKKDAWTLRLVYNDGNIENISMVKPNDDKDEYIMSSDKDSLKARFAEDPSDGVINVPKDVIDHIAKHIEQAEDNIAADKKDNDCDLAQEIAFDIKKEFPNYDMEVIDGDLGSTNWNIQIVYKDGSQDNFSIMKVGRRNYVMKSKDGFIAKFTLDELKNMPKQLKDHIEKHARRSK